jgi:hypothetical protein
VNLALVFRADVARGENRRTSQRPIDATARDANLRRVLDLPTVVRFFVPMDVLSLLGLNLDTEQMTAKKWKSCRAHRHHQPCRRSG